MNHDAPAREQAPLRARLLGVDAARAVALVGMFATHLLPLHDDANAPTLTGLLADGRASALFAVLAGVGVALSTGGVRRPPDARAHLAAGAGLVVRGLLVAVLGLWLIGYDSPVAVILPYYGLLFLVAIPLLRLPAPALAALAVLSCGLAPVLSHLLRSGLPAGPGPQPGLDALARPGELLTTLALTGYYPVLPWTTYLLAGMAIGRLDLRRVRVAVGLLAAGTAVAVGAVLGSRWLLGPGGGAAQLGAEDLAARNYGTTPTDSWWWLTIMAPHSGTPFDLAHTTGTALAVLGSTLLLARLSRVLVWVPAAVGAIPLTLYTLHVLVLSLDSGRNEPEQALLGLWTAHVAGAVVLGVLVRLTGRRGPLEAVVSLAGRTARRMIDPRSGRPGPGGAGAGAATPTGEPGAAPSGDPATMPSGVPTGTPPGEPAVGPAANPATPPSRNPAPAPSPDEATAPRGMPVTVPPGSTPREPVTDSLPVVPAPPPRPPLTADSNPTTCSAPAHPRPGDSRRWRTNPLSEGAVRASGTGWDREG